MKLTESNPYGLTNKQLEFCKYYTGLLGNCKYNGQESAIQAGYSKRTAAVIAAENLTKPNVIQHLEFLAENMRQTAEKTPGDAMRELEEIAFANPLNYLEIITANIKEGDKYNLKQTIVLKDSKDWPGAAAIQEISQTRDGSIKIKLHNKASALDSLLQLHNLFPAKKMKVEATGKDGEPLNASVPAQYVFFLPKDNPELIPPNQQPTPQTKEIKEEKPKAGTKSQEAAIDLVKSLINKTKGKEK